VIAADRIKQILVAVDGSPESHAAIDYAVLLAVALNASITLVHVTEVPNQMIGVVPGATVANVAATSRQSAVRGLDALVAYVHGQGFTRVRSLIESASSVAGAIRERALLDNYDLIVMGTHGRSGVARFVLGSVAEGVLRQAACPVLTVHLPPSQ
jgi:nucleotide-binding universal stress UspA family protein